MKFNKENEPKTWPNIQKYMSPKLCLNRISKIISKVNCLSSLIRARLSEAVIVSSMEQPENIVSIFTEMYVDKVNI